MGKSLVIVDQLKENKIVKYRPKGNSMTGKISSGDLVTIEPIGERKLEKGNIVFCKVKGNFYLHLITAIKGNQYQISNNHGRINGWTTKKSIFGICTSVES